MWLICNIPAGFTLRYGTDGELDLMSNQGDTVATVDAPWAVDATGQHLPTYYELIPASSTIRQHVDMKGATYPIAVDPSWWWWTKNVISCSVGLGSLLASGGAALASRIPQVVSAINKLAKTKAIAVLVKKVGGAKKAAYALVKNVAARVRNLVSEKLRGKIPSVKLTNEEKAFINRVWNNIDLFGLAGLTGCKNIYNR
ncbi:MAG: hypothetical protein J6M18_02040 [Actinomycetaceae bacterium]|nr:hypothetical protein [Actinomycetaceae bacterium]